MRSDEHAGYTTAVEVAATFAVSKQRVYAAANRYTWRRYWLNGHVRYHIDDVIDTFAYLAARPTTRPRSSSGQFTASER